MKLWLLNYRFIQLKIVSFILSTIFLTIGLIAVNIMAAVIENNMRTFRVISELDKKNYVFFSQENKISLQGVLNTISDGECFNITDHETLDDLIDETIMQLKGVSSICGVSVTSAECEESEDFYLSMHQLSPELDETLKIPLARGTWCKKATNDKIEAVISNTNRFNIGDVLHITMNGEPYELIITGILESPALEFQMNTSGDQMCSLDFLYPFEEKSTEGKEVLVYVSSSWNKFDDIPKDAGRIIFFDDKLSLTDMQKNLTILSNKGFTAQNEELKKGTKEQIHICLSKYLPTVIFLILIVILGLTSSAILNTLEYRKHFAVFFIVGCTWTQCIIINLMYICSSVAISVIIYSVFQIFFSSYHFYDINLLLTIGLCMFVIVISAIIPYNNMKKTTPKELITLENE